MLGPPFRAVVFDLDGTLLDTEALSDEAMLRALAHILKSLLYSDFARTGFRARARPEPNSWLCWASMSHVYAHADAHAHDVLRTVPRWW